MDTGADAREEVTEPERKRVLAPLGPPLLLFWLLLMMLLDGLLLLPAPPPPVRVLISNVLADGRSRIDGNGGLGPLLPPASIVELFVLEPGAE